MANVLFLRNLDRELLRQFKAHCAMLGVTMTERVQELLRKDVKRASVSTDHRS